VKDEAFYNRVSADRIASRQIDELIGLARGLCADGILNQAEVEYLEKWLAANTGISDQPLIRTLYERVHSVLADGQISGDEQADLFAALDSLSDRDFEVGEVLKPTTLPLCNPAPNIVFADRSFVFTGTFSYGQRKECVRAVEERGGFGESLTQGTDYLVIGTYVTESWKHSAFGNKILKASEMRGQGIPISIISEKHWSQFL
jgi:NAD-dependent DNA ligase